MELAEEDGIVRIRRRDFTKRRLPMCNSFWRPWNCYCEKFSSCNSSTESPQIGRIQPPYYPAAYSTNTTIGTTPTFLWGMTASVGGGCNGLGFNEFCSFQKYASVSVEWMTNLMVWCLSVCAANQVEVCWSVASLLLPNNMPSLLLYLATETFLL